MVVHMYYNISIYLLCGVNALCTIYTLITLCKYCGGPSSRMIYIVPRPVTSVRYTYTTRNLQLLPVVREATDDNDDRVAVAIYHFLSYHNFSVCPVSTEKYTLIILKT